MATDLGSGEAPAAKTEADADDRRPRQACALVARVARDDRRGARGRSRSARVLSAPADGSDPGVAAADGPAVKRVRRSARRARAKENKQCCNPSQKVPQGAEGPQHGVAARCRSVLRRILASKATSAAGRRARSRPPVVPSRATSSAAAHLHPHLPGQAGLQKPAEVRNGQRQGQPGVLGG